MLSITAKRDKREMKKSNKSYYASYILFQMCPHPGDVSITDEFSSCIVDFHCSGQQICCKNFGKCNHWGPVHL